MDKFKKWLLRIELTEKNIKKMQKFTTVLLIICCNSIFSQTGPGGIGNASTLTLWLDIDRGITVTTDGASIALWSDQSGNGNDALQTVVSNQPTYRTGVVNGKSSLRFDGSDDWMGITMNANETNVTKFIVFKTRGGDGSGSIIATSTPVSASAGSHDRQFGLLGNKVANRLWSVQTVSSSTDFNDNSSHILNVNYGASLSGQEIYADGLFQISGNKPSSDFNWDEGLVIGGHNYWGYLNCDLMEIIEYSSIANTAQRIIIENYLAAKYNVSLSANDIYRQDNPGRGNYDHEVAGIGRIDASNIQDDSKGTGIVQILNPSGLGNNEFLIWGHDGGVQQATNTIDVPSGVEARFDRVWRVNEVDLSGSSVNVGAIDMRFDLSGLGPITASDLVLLVDTNNDGVFSDETPITGASSLGSGIYEFSSVTPIRNNRRFTIGTISVSTTPLPIELNYFSAKPIRNSLVAFNWQTATEINNDYFTIERSENGDFWEELHDVDGAGNSIQLIDYESVDYEPYSGISYYRLKQTDFNGLASYSGIRTVNLDRLIKNTLEVYPNPTISDITIIGEESELDEIKIYNSLGEDVTKLVEVKENTLRFKRLDLSQLSSGMYYVKTNLNTVKVFKN